MDLIWLKEMSCPVCDNLFQSENVRQHKLRQIRADEDFHTYYDQLSPLYYAIVVCPECFYSERRNEFPELSGKTMSQVKRGIPELKQLAGGMNFNRARDLQLAVKSFELGALTVQLKGCSSDVIGGMYMRAAWIFREVCDEDSEKEYLMKTLELYETAYMKERSEFGQLGACGFQYLMGEIYRHLGDLKKASDMYSHALADEDIKQKKQVERLARDQLSLVKSQLKGG